MGIKMRLNMKTVCMLCVIAACMLWASSGIITHFIRDYGFDTGSIGFLNWLCSAMVAFTILMIFDRKSLLIDKKILCLALLMGVVNIVASISSISAVFSIPTGLSSVLQNLTPYFTMVMAFFIFKDRITKKHIICSCIGIAGCMLIQINTSNGDIAVTGVLLSILASVMFAANNIGMKAMLNAGATVMSVLLYANLFSAIIYLPLLNVNNFIGPIVTYPESFLVCMLICTAISFLPMLLNTFALKTLDVTTVTIMDLMEVFFAITMGILFMGEAYDTGALVGLVAILASGILINHEFKKDVKDADTGS